jgi:hypothetical protein
LQPSSDHAIAVPETNEQSEREKLIRRKGRVAATQARRDAARI